MNTSNIYEPPKSGEVLNSGNKILMYSPTQAALLQQSLTVSG